MAKRAYVSPSREAQAAATRERILDATIEILGDGLADLTVPAVAKRSGLSVPTVYRYFGDKEALVDAAADHVRESLSVTTLAAPPSSLAQFLEMQRQIFRQQFLWFCYLRRRHGPPRIFGENPFHIPSDPRVKHKKPDLYEADTCHGVSRPVGSRTHY